MSEFRNVTVERKANVYFKGKVASRTILFEDGTKKTLGTMMPGSYKFNTVDEEIMEMLGGQLEVLLPGETKWKTVEEGESFIVPAHSKFKVKVPFFADYCCSYLK